ncbi:MAG: YggS family pyridoxal phosphate-dependent enzyme [Alphaproteobacteria bacterium]
MSTDLQQLIATNLTTVHERIALAARSASRDAADVKLIAVSKAQPDERIEAALMAGHRIFGENRVQEAVRHWTDRRARWPDLELHLIGPLQTNKVKQAVRLFDVIQTVDRPKLARRLADEFATSGQTRPCYVEVNTGEEPRKAGVMPAEADEFIEWCGNEAGLRIVGLMAIPPLDDEPSLHFALLREIAKRHRLPRLSMGMSADYEIAVELGATDVCVGTAIFGEREIRAP